jgi:hypothetical protein
MLNETSEWDIVQSLRYCGKYFAAYAEFATMPLLTAVMNSPHADVGDFMNDFTTTGWLSSTCQPVQGFIDDLEMDDQDFFGIKDYEFFLRMPFPDGERNPPSEDRLAMDEKSLILEINKPMHMLRSHAEILLKACRFWKLRYHEKGEEWVRRYDELFGAYVNRMLRLEGTTGNVVENVEGNDTE